VDPPSECASFFLFPHIIPPNFDIPVLARIQDFLPRLKAENDSLVQRIRDNPSSVDIENIEEDAEQYIEMASLSFPPFPKHRKKERKNSQSTHRTLAWVC